jgi:hypothetical protein
LQCPEHCIALFHRDEEPEPAQQNGDFEEHNAEAVQNRHDVR